MISSRLGLLFAFFSLLTTLASGQTAPGLKLRFNSSEEQKLSDSRVTRMPALVVRAGESPSPFLAPGPFTATWTGQLNLPLRDRYRFHAEGNGRLQITLNGEPILNSTNSTTSDWVRLQKGANTFKATYESPNSGDAVIRLLWSSADHPAESIPPTRWTHLDPDPFLGHAQSMRRGRNLFAERQCLRCHSGGNEYHLGAGMPELAKDAPLLLDIGVRLRGDWMARWIENPAACREQTTMPRFFHGPNAQQQSRHVAAYLTTLQLGTLANKHPVPDDEATVREGATLYTSLGCVACHSVEKSPGTKTNRISLRHVRDKFQPPALREYLVNPSRGYQATRMPHFDLTNDEATAVAAFLLKQSDPPPAPAPVGDPARGKELAEAAGCIVCHPLPITSTFSAPALADFGPLKQGRGCLSTTPDKAPDLGLNEQSINDLKRFLQSGLPSLKRHTPAEFAERQITSHQCTACHERDARTDDWTRFQHEVAQWAPKKKVNHEGQPEPAQDRPSLTWTGEKLHADWVEELLSGNLQAPARPWLKARMPAYRPHAAGLARGLADSHGVPGRAPDDEAADPTLAAIGRDLVTKHLGFGCSDCHGIGDQDAVAVFEAEGVNFRHAHERLRTEYYHRLLRDPTRIDPKTTMPRYGDAHGYTPITDVLDGDAERQFEAIRHYLLAGSAIQPPPKPNTGKRRDVSMHARAGGDAGGEREPDWVDGRWQLMDNGPAVFNAYRLPGGSSPRGIAIRLGAPFSAAMIFDQERLTWRAAWTGDFLQFGDRRFGLMQGPKIAGDLHFTNPGLLGTPFMGSFDDPRERKIGPMPDRYGRYEGLHLHGQRSIVSYRLGQTAILDAPGVVHRDGLTTFTRSLEIAPSQQPLRLFLLGGQKKARGEVRTIDGIPIAILPIRGQLHAVAVVGNAIPVVEAKSTLVLKVPAHPGTERLRICYFTGPEAELAKFAALVKATDPPEDLSALTQGGPRRWGDPLVTRGHVSTRKDPLVIDTVTMPYDNPWNALLFAGGHDFLPDGRAAVCTLHGDVWLVDGIDDTLEHITWKRFATGLYQPLGLKIVDGRIHVGCRDQIVIPEDRNGDGEADFYRNFSSLVHVNGGGHSFHTCLETDPEGNFYFLKCANGGSKHGGTLLKVSPDGRRIDTVATGFRNPNGLGMSPDGMVTEADQQGNWVPETRLDIIQPGGFYGFMPMHHRNEEPKIYDGPTCWIPRPLDNSAGGQVWIDNPAWGPLDKKMLHLSWGRCTTMMVLTEKIGDTWQGGVVPLPGQFLSGVHRGRHRPQDGHLYLTGCDGWQTAAVRDGCFQRLRRTDIPIRLPVALNVHQNGIRVTFSQALDPNTAADPAAYAVERWNYRWASKYGSADWSVADPNRQGRDPMPVNRVDISDDGRSVFLHLNDLKPVMQMRLEYNLDAANGTLLRGELPFTIHKMRP